MLSKTVHFPMISVQQEAVSAHALFFPSRQDARDSRDDQRVALILSLADLQDGRPSLHYVDLRLKSPRQGKDLWLPAPHSRVLDCVAVVQVVLCYRPVNVVSRCVRSTLL